MRLIDADALREKHCEGCSDGVRESRKDFPVCASLMWVVEEPTIDAVHVVRCKDCWKRYDIDECPMCSLHYLKYTDYTEDDGFCDRGDPRSHHDSLCDQNEEGRK